MSERRSDLDKQQPTKQETEPYILFELLGATYGLRSRSVKQMEMVEHITPVPNARPFVDGVVFSRGQVIPALNLRRRFGFDKAPYDLRTRLIVVTSAGRTAGLIVDTAREFVSIAAETIQPPPDAIAGLSGCYLQGIASLKERLVLILNVEAILNDADLGADAATPLSA